MIELDFCGLWRQGKDETHEFLMQVISWRMGCSVEREGAQYKKLWLRAEVVKYTEGVTYPRVFEIVLPKKGFIFVPDTFYNNSRIYGEQKHFFVEFSGNIYGPSPLTGYKGEGRDVLTISTPGTKENQVEKKWVETANMQRFMDNIDTLTDGRTGKQESKTACEKEPKGVK